MTLRFGTDGVRGVANSELTPELVMALSGVDPEWALSKRNWGQLGATPDDAVLSTRLTTPTSATDPNKLTRRKRMVLP